MKALDPDIRLVNEFVSEIRVGPKRSQHFESIQKTSFLSKQPLKLKKDVVTRWNSTYEMLDRALQLKDSIDMAKDQIQDIDRTRIVWNSVERITKFLKLFLDATTILSSESTVTISLVASTYRILQQHVHLEHGHELINMAATATGIGQAEPEETTRAQPATDTNQENTSGPTGQQTSSDTGRAQRNRQATSIQKTSRPRRDIQVPSRYK